jgi:phage repressor protein C with HTH and peptisase S24 domain
VPARKPRSKVTLHADEDEALRPRSQRIPEGFIGIAEIDVRASAGSGAFNEGLEETKATWLLPEAIVRHEFRAPPNELRMITVDGDSMEPLLSSGDRILIDTSQRVPVLPGIFVIWDGMGLVAKRVEHIPNSDPPKVLIKSVNPEYQAYERIAEEVNVVGRVVRVCIHRNVKKICPTLSILISLSVIPGILSDLAKISVRAIAGIISSMLCAPELSHCSLH